MAAIVCAAQGGDVFGPQPGEAKPQPRPLPSGETAETRERWARARQLLDDHAARRISSDAQRRCLTGLAPLDEALGGGMPLGTLCEMVAANEGLGVTDLALRVAWAATGHTRMLFLIDPPGHLYPPTLVRRGVGLQRLVILRGLRRTDAIWAMEQILRCGAVGAVLGLFGVPDVRSARRLQLAAEAGGRLGLLVHGDTEGIPAQFAALRMIIETAKTSEVLSVFSSVPQGPALASNPQSRSEAQIPARRGTIHNPQFTRCLHVRLLKTRTRTALDSFLLELGDAAGDVRVHAVPGDGRVDVRHRAIG